MNECVYERWRYVGKKEGRREEEEWNKSKKELVKEGIKLKKILTQMLLLHGFSRVGYKETYFFKLLGTYVKLMRRKTRTWPCSVKMFETDIYQVFVQMRQATPGQMFSILFSHL
jgi:hypothetical protein